MNRFIAIILIVITFAAGPRARAAAVGKSHINPITVRRDLKDILSAPEYNRTSSESPSTKWISKWIIRPVTNVLKWIGRAILHAIGWLLDKIIIRRVMGADGWFTFVLAWIVIIAFAFLLALVIRWVGQSAGERIRIAREDDIEAYELPSAAPLIKQADKLAGSGDFRGAFRTAYLAIISYLDEIKALRFERSRTNWEYLGELKDGGKEKPYNELRPLTISFDRKIYGREECSHKDYLDAVGAYDRISREVSA